VIVPRVGFEVFERKLAHDPGLARRVNDHLLARVGKNASAAFLIEHAVVVGPVGNNVALITGHDRLAEVRALDAAILQAAIAGRTDLDLHAELEVLERSSAPRDESIEAERAVSLAGQATVLDRPIRGASFPTGEVATVENGLKARGRLWRARVTRL